MIGFQAVILAAGAGSRFGGAKLLAEWSGRPLICAAVETALSTRVDEVIVVLGCHAEEVLGALTPSPDARLRCIVAADWADGQSASLKRAIHSLPGDSLGFLLFLGDMPCVPADLALTVLERLREGAAAVQPFHQNTPSHPVGFSAALYGSLLALEGDVGARSLLRERDDVLRLDVNCPGALFDIDRPDDLEQPTDRAGW